ncbi:hypothetical protein C8C98_2756 [Acidovorax sp. 106]|nr:hypothetical protein C8C98_2756 [Acidovorax sp. 106]
MTCQRGAACVRRSAPRFLMQVNGLVGVGALGVMATRQKVGACAMLIA